MNRLDDLVRQQRQEPVRGVQARLATARAALKAAKDELMRQEQRRAVESTKSSPSFHILEAIDNAIKTAETEIKRLPFTIEMLEKQVEVANEQELASKERRDAFIASMPVKAMQAKSKLLLKHLRAALVMNDELLQYYADRALIEKETGKQIDLPPMCGGFHSLQILVAMCEAENNGQGRAVLRWSGMATPGGDLI